MIGITLLGATGSIGVNTLDVIAHHRDRYQPVALTANRNLELLVKQCVEWQPRYAVIADEALGAPLREALRERGLATDALCGTQGLIQVASLPEADCVVAAIVGAAGLLPTLAAAQHGKRILLANKEALVMSGQLFMDAVRASGAELLPVDSEHNAIFQSMPANFRRGLDEVGIEKILLTASGGPFRNTPLDGLSAVTPEQACAHPNWNMGKKISVDSASMMNKALEVIEACWLFDTVPDKIQVVLHPQSIIHSMVQYVDGSVLAQLGAPDMRTPIAHALAWPERISTEVTPLDLFDVARLDFEAPDLERFPSLRLAAEVMSAGGTASAIMNAANEVAVDAFLCGSIKFTDIPRMVEKSLEQIAVMHADSVETVLAADAEARSYTRSCVHSVVAA